MKLHLSTPRLGNPWKGSRILRRSLRAGGPAPEPLLAVMGEVLGVGPLGCPWEIDHHTKEDWGLSLGKAIWIFVWKDNQTKHDSPCFFHIFIFSLLTPALKHRNVQGRWLSSSRAGRDGNNNPSFPLPSAFFSYICIPPFLPGAHSGLYDLFFSFYLLNNSVR